MKIRGENDKENGTESILQTRSFRSIDLFLFFKHVYLGPLGLHINNQAIKKNVPSYCRYQSC